VKKYLASSQASLTTISYSKTLSTMMPTMVDNRNLTNTFILFAEEDISKNQVYFSNTTSKSNEIMIP